MKAYSATVRLLPAYLEGYRSADWPEQSRPSLAASR
ncbi:hypothetical protein LA5095_00762 [Roseibium album]|uniref:Uncharacterized protein n=1 Tax=Roseibium album TaxID=311410 RepID=A0A0M7AKE0_9HYPH|nr:hypothetical protein LA5094_03207 [Roseibium album]CTQ66163.1 hypothetical protein LA5095_00762 [Roseibium album]CTQ74064.1 hypothetical protein LA5096_03902 [Roseibium album]